LWNFTFVHWVEPEGPDELRHAWVDLTGEHLGALTAQRGDGLTALQYVTRLIVARELGHPLPVVVDAEGFRERREQQLRRMARRAALQVMEHGRTVALEPMSAADRRIVHLELRGHDEVYTESVGTGNHRKVTIIPRAAGEVKPAAE
jgi:spoIIIJ-associated protein